MRLRTHAAALALALLPAAPAGAWFPPSAVQNLLLAADSPADLRARLRARADSVAASSPADAGEAWYCLGLSAAEAGMADTARAAWRRARALRGDAAEDLALAGLALDRGGPGELAEARDLLEPHLAEAGDERAPEGAGLRLALAWAQAGLGDRAAALAMLDDGRSALWVRSRDPVAAAEWGRRYGPFALSAGRRDEGLRLLEPLLARSRAMDTALVRAAGEAFPPALRRRFAMQVAGAVAREDSAAARSIAFARARPRALTAEDGFPLRCWVSAGPRPRSPLVLVALAPEEGGPGAADSLAAHLRRAGCAVALLEPRGTGGSVAPGCALPDAWRGHEEQRVRRAARDLVVVLDALVRDPAVDPARIALAGAGTNALAAALAAESDARVRALVLAGPKPSPVQRGWLRASLAAGRAPVFVQTGPEDVSGNEVLDRIVAALPMRRVRVSDSQAPGSGARLFRGDAKVGRRLSDWLGEQWAPRATPPPRRRRG